jgi:hypothetical protein
MARKQMDKVLKDTESLETEENQGYVKFWHNILDLEVLY